MFVSGLHPGARSLVPSPVPRPHLFSNKKLSALSGATEHTPKGSGTSLLTWIWTSCLSLVWDLGKVLSVSEIHWPHPYNQTLALEWNCVDSFEDIAQHLVFRPHFPFRLLSSATGVPHPSSVPEILEGINRKFSLEVFHKPSINSPYQIKLILRNNYISPNFSLGFQF